MSSSFETNKILREYLTRLVSTVGQGNATVNSNGSLLTSDILTQASFGSLEGITTGTVNGFVFITTSGDNFFVMDENAQFSVDGFSPEQLEPNTSSKSDPLVRITGIGPDGLEVSEELITGTSTANTFIHINSASTLDGVMSADVEINGASTGDLHGVIAENVNYLNKAGYVVPLNKDMYITSIRYGVANGVSRSDHVDFRLHVGDFVENTYSAVRHIFQTSGGTSIETLTVPIFVKGGEGALFEAKSQGNTLQAFAGFDYILIDKE